MSKFRIVRSPKHHLLRLYRVSPLWRQVFNRANQMYVSCKVKSALSKNEKGRSCSQVKKHSSGSSTVTVKSSGDNSAEPVRGQKIEEHVVTDRRTSKSIIEKHDRWDDWRCHWRHRYRSLGPLASQYTGKRREYWLKYEAGSFWHCDEKSLLKHDVPQHTKDRNFSRKCTTSLIRRQNHNSEVVGRSWFCFYLSQIVLNV